MNNLWKGIAAGVLGLAVCASADARITRIVIDETVPLVEPAGGMNPGIAYEQVAGRAFGELDPKLPGNALIQDIELAKDADGKVRYVTPSSSTSPWTWPAQAACCGTTCRIAGACLRWRRKSASSVT